MPSGSIHAVCLSLDDGPARRALPLLAHFRGKSPRSAAVDNPPLLHPPQDYFTSDRLGLQRQIKALEELIERIDQPLHLHLQVWHTALYLWGCVGFRSCSIARLLCPFRSLMFWWGLSSHSCDVVLLACSLAAAARRQLHAGTWTYISGSFVPWFHASGCC